MTQRRDNPGGAQDQRWKKQQNGKWDWTFRQDFRTGREIKDWLVVGLLRAGGLVR
jgi:hypothetical protein